MQYKKIVKELLALFYLLSAFVFSVQSQADEANLIANSGAEEVIAVEEAKKLIPPERHHGEIYYFGLVPSTMIPKHWLPYSGGGYGVWGASTEQAYSGRYSVFLTFKNFQKFEGRNIAVLFLHTEPVEVEPDTEYEFSFWIKGNIPLITIKGFLFNHKDERVSLELGGLMRTLRKNGVPLRSMQRGSFFIAPEEQWSQYSLILKTKSDSKRIQMRIGVDDTNQPLESGQTIYVDEVRLLVKK